MAGILFICKTMSLLALNLAEPIVNVFLDVEVAALVHRCRLVKISLWIFTRLYIVKGVLQRVHEFLEILLI